jgi:hypothetical protein
MWRHLMVVVAFATEVSVADRQSAGDPQGVSPEGSLPLLVGSSVVVSPHPQNLNDLFLLKNLIHQTVLDVDPAGVCSQQISNKGFKWRRISKGILLNDLQEFLGLLCEGSSLKFFCVFLCLASKSESVAHRSISSSQSLIGSFIPAIIDSLIPGMLRR